MHASLSSSQHLDLKDPLEMNPRGDFSIQYFPIWNLDGPIALKLAVQSDDLQELSDASYGADRAYFFGRDCVQCAWLEAGLGFFMAVILLNLQFPRVIHEK